MDVVSLCTLRASGFAWQPRAGTHALTVLCKGTFELRPGACVLAAEQDDIAESDAYWNDDPRRSVVVPSDRAPYKPRADVVLVGHAFAPARVPTRSVTARLRVGVIDKSIEVWCDRARLEAGHLIEGNRQAKLLLTWERAAGGPETHNPVGIPLDGAPDRHGRVALPSLQPPGWPTQRWADTYTPLGYGPIAPHWPGRVQKLHWQGGTHPLADWECSPLPAQFNYEYFNMAPPDQQITELRGGIPIILENLHPRHEHLLTRFPELRPRAIADRAGRREDIALVPDTLWIDSDRGLCTVVWRGRIGLLHPEEAGRVAFWLDGPATSTVATLAESRDLHARDSSEKSTGDATIVPVAGGDIDEGRATLPFAPASHVRSPLTIAEPPASPPETATAPARSDGTETLAAPMVVRTEDALPFGHRRTTLGTSSSLMSTAALPQAPAEHEMRAIALEPQVSGVAPSNSSSLPSFTPCPPLVLDATDEGGHARATPPPMPGPPAAPDIPTQPLAPPSTLGALPRGDPPPIASTTPVTPSLPLGAYPLERCAAIAASMARTPAEAADVLLQHGLQAAEWDALDHHWTEAIRGESERGRVKLLRAYDGAYVSQIEAERGAISVGDYAAILLSAERGSASSTLAELSIPTTALLAIQRVWLHKVAEDAALGAAVRSALEAAVEEED